MKKLNKQQITKIVKEKIKKISVDKRRTLAVAILRISDKNIQKFLSDKNKKKFDNWMFTLLTGNYTQNYGNYSNKNKTKFCSLGVLFHQNPNILEKDWDYNLGYDLTNSYMPIKEAEFERLIINSNIDNIYEVLNDTFKLTFREIEAFTRIFLIPCFKQKKYSQILKLVNLE